MLILPSKMITSSQRWNQSRRPNQRQKRPAAVPMTGLVPMIFAVKRATACSLTALAISTFTVPAARRTSKRVHRDYTSTQPATATGQITSLALALIRLTFEPFSSLIFQHTFTYFPSIKALTAFKSCSYGTSLVNLNIEPTCTITTLLCLVNENKIL